MVILISSAAASVVVGIVAFDLFKSRQLKKRLAAGAPLPTAFDRHSDAATNYAVIQQQANASNASSWGMP
jgi:hypothetical protein